jgi:hypothetical protein
MQLKDKPSLAKIKVPEKEVRQGNTTRLTVIPDTNDTLLSKNESLVTIPPQENNIVFKSESFKTLSKLQKESVDLGVKSSPPELTELEAVNLQLTQLQEIRSIAQTLKSLREERDKEKKIFDNQVKKLSSVRVQINQ